MSQANWNPGWLDQNGQRNYPLADSASGVDTTGAFVLPKDFLVNLSVPVSTLNGSDPARFFLSRINSYVSGFSLTVSYQPTVGDAVRVGQVSFTRDAHSRNATYAFVGQGAYFDSYGSCSIGQFDGIDLQPAGVWEFGFAEGRLDPDAIRPALRGVSSLSVTNGTTTGTPLVGAIGLQEGTNIRLSVVTQGGNQYIRVDAISGEGLNQDCSCDDTPSSNVPITSINGRGGEQTNFEFFAGNCVSITPVDNGIRIDNTCSKPCCGCPELEKITTDLAVVLQQVASLESWIGSLQTSVTTMDQVVLGSKLNDGGCSL